MEFRVVLQGRAAAGKDPGEVKRRFMKMTGQSEPAAERLFNGRPHTVKRHLVEAEADRIVNKLRAIGALATVEPESPAATEIEVTVMGEPEAVARRRPEAPPAAFGLALVPDDDHPDPALAGDSETSRTPAAALARPAPAGPGLSLVSDDRPPPPSPRPPRDPAQPRAPGARPMPAPHPQGHSAPLAGEGGATDSGNQEGGRAETGRGLWTAARQPRVAAGIALVAVLAAVAVVTLVIPSPTPASPAPSAIAPRTHSRPAAAPGPAGLAPLTFQPAHLAGDWRCVDQRSGQASYWRYVADGSLAGFGDSEKAMADGTPVAVAGMPDRWSLADGRISFSNGEPPAGPGFHVDELTPTRFRYIAAENTPVECRRP